jgi:hypothetical protein
VRVYNGSLRRRLDLHREVPIVLVDELQYKEKRKRDEQTNET